MNITKKQDAALFAIVVITTLADSAALQFAPCLTFPITLLGCLALLKVFPPA